MALRWKSRIDHFASFRLPSFDGSNEAAQILAHELRTYLVSTGETADDVDDEPGHEALWFFPVTTDGFFLYVSVEPKSDCAWELHIQAADAGLLERRWRPRFDAMKRIEWRLHEHLLERGALDLSWHVEEHDGDPGQPTP